MPVEKPQPLLWGMDFSLYLCLKGDFENGYSKNGYIGCY